MRVALLHGPGDLRIERRPAPEPGPGEIVLRVECALVGPRELTAFLTGGDLLVDGGGAPVGAPLCGSDARGTRYVAASSVPCGRCAGCRSPHAGRCDTPVALAGSLAELVVVPARIAEVGLARVPAGLPAAVAALGDGLAACLAAVERAGVRTGQVVAIVGAGTIGLLTCACAADAGGWPVVVGGRQERRALAPAFGARPADPRDADVVIEAAGTEQARRDALALAHAGGRVVLLGDASRGELLAVDAFRLREEALTLAGAAPYEPRHLRAAIAFLASGAHPWESLVSHRVALDGVGGLLGDPPADMLRAEVVP